MSRSNSPRLQRHQYDALIELKKFAWIPLISMLLMHIVKPMCYDLVLPFISTFHKLLAIIKFMGSRSNGSRERRCLRSERSRALCRIHWIHVCRNESRHWYDSYPFSIKLYLTSTHLVILWTFLSDRIGRKPIVIGGIFGLAFCIALFGLSKPYWLMVTTMAVGGIFSGTRTWVSLMHNGINRCLYLWRTMRVMLTELYPVKSHRITAFSACQVSTPPFGEYPRYLYFARYRSVQAKWWVTLLVAFSFTRRSVFMSSILLSGTNIHLPSRVWLRASFLLLQGC